MRDFDIFDALEKCGTREGRIKVLDELGVTDAESRKSFLAGERPPDKPPKESKRKTETKRRTEATPGEKSLKEYFAPFFDPKALKAGYVTIDDPAYRSIKAINASTLKQPTTEEMKHALFSEFDPLKVSLMQGSLVDRAILEPDIWETKDTRDEWLVIVKTATLRTKEAKAAFEANPDKVIATTRMVEKAAKAHESIYGARGHKQAKYLLSRPGIAKSVGVDFDEETGVWRKCQDDFRPLDVDAGWKLDLKTTSKPVAYLNALANEKRFWGYDVQARHYSEIHEGITGKAIDFFAFLWIQGPWADSADVNDAPCIPRITTLTREPDVSPSLVSVQPIYRDRLAKFVNAAQTDVWEAWENENVIVGHAF